MTRSIPNKLVATLLLGVLPFFLLLCGKSNSGSDGGSGAQNTTTSTHTSSTADLTYLNFAKAIIDRACVPCHQSPPAQGAPDTFVLSAYEDSGSLLGISSKLTLMRQKLADRLMPRGTFTLTEDERAGLIAWIDNGGPKGTSTKQVTPPTTTTPTGSDSTTTPVATGIDFSHPSSAGETADSSFSITVSFSESSSGDTWSVYYTPLQGATSSGTPISLDLPVSTTSATWTTASVASGSYYLYVELTHKGSLVKQASVGAVTVQHPSLSFSAPSTDDTANASYTIKVTFTDVSSSATWDLFYTTTAGAVSGGTAIATKIPVSTTSQSWNTSALTADTYSLYATLHDDGADSNYVPTGSITVSHPAPNDHLPVVSAVTPNGGEFYLAGTQVNITYTATDADSDPLTYKIESSNDSGKSWTLLTASTSSTTFAWDTTAIAQGVSYRIRVSANDGKGGIGVRSSKSNFGIATADVTYSTGSGQISALMSTYCSKCHSAGGRGSAFFVWTPYLTGNPLGPGVASVRAKIQSFAEGSNPAMPPSGNPKPTNAERDLLQLWLWNAGKE